VAEEPVTAPDQLKPTNLKWARIGGIGSIIALLSMTSPFNNHTGWMEDVWLVVVAGGIAVALVGEAVLRRRGLRA
jgi:hypothetical protein